MFTFSFSFKIAINYKILWSETKYLRSILFKRHIDKGFVKVGEIIDPPELLQNQGDDGKFFNFEIIDIKKEH